MKKIVFLFVLAVAGSVLLFNMTSNGNSQQVNQSASVSIGDMFLVSGQSNTSVVVIDYVVMEQPGFIVLREVINNRPGQIVEASQYLQKGEYTNIIIDLNQPIPGEVIDISGEFPLSIDTVAVVYVDNGDQGFNPSTDTPSYYNEQVLARFVRTGATAPEQVVIPNAVSTETMSVEMTVVYTDSGFSPGTVEVVRGDTVRFINKSSRPMWVASNEHPAHTNLRTFDQFEVSAFDESYEYTFDTVGAWKYHDHVNASQEGTITVHPNN